MSNFTFFHIVFSAICIFKFFQNHISVVVCSFFEFETVSKWIIWESLKQLKSYRPILTRKLLFVILRVLNCWLQLVRWNWFGFSRQDLMIVKQRVHSKIRQHLCTDKSCSTPYAKINLWSLSEGYVLKLYRANKRIKDISGNFKVYEWSNIFIYTVRKKKVLFLTGLSTGKRLL